MFLSPRPLPSSYPPVVTPVGLPINQLPLPPQTAFPPLFLRRSPRAIKQSTDTSATAADVPSSRVTRPHAITDTEPSTHDERTSTSSAARHPRREKRRRPRTAPWPRHTAISQCQARGRQRRRSAPADAIPTNLARPPPRHPHGQHHRAPGTPAQQGRTAGTERQRGQREQRRPQPDGKLRPAGRPRQQPHVGGVAVFCTVFCITVRPGWRKTTWHARSRECGGVLVL